MNPLAIVLDDIALAFKHDCYILSEAVTDSLSETFALSSRASQDFWCFYWNAFSPTSLMAEDMSEDGDDLFNAVCGDLGLGETQKSSFFLNYDLEINKYFSSPAYCQLSNISHSESDLSSLQQERKHRVQNLFRKGFLNSVFSLGHSVKYAVNHEPAKSDSESEVFPTYAEVQYGTSYRQQKKLYDQEMDHLMRQQSNSSPVPDDTVKRFLDGQQGSFFFFSFLKIWIQKTISCL